MTSGSAVDQGLTVRRLIRQADIATLASAARPGSPAEGHPYASLVLVAADYDAAPLLLISGLAEHTRNIAADARVSLLFNGTAGLADPLEGARVTLIGEVQPARAERQRARFLARHPAAAYADFGDFSLVRVAPRRAHLVAGFGRISWLEAGAFVFDVHPAAALIEAESGIVSHMNNDHVEALELYAKFLLGRAETGWRMCGIDPEGLDLRAGPALARLDFEQPIRTPSEARALLLALAAQARSAAAANSG